MTLSVHSCAFRIGSLAVLWLTGLPGSFLQGSEAAVIETSAVLTSESTGATTTTSSINPWPTDTTYTYTSECVVATTDAPASDCMLFATVYSPDPGFVTNYCGRRNYTITETRTLTVDCGGCDKVSVTVKRGGCPNGVPHPITPTLQSTPLYVYRWECASTTEPSLPTISACPP